MSNAVEFLKQRARENGDEAFLGTKLVLSSEGRDR